MKKRVVLVLLGLVAALGLAVLAFAVLLSFLSLDRRAEFESPGVMVVDLDGLVVERQPPDFLTAELLGARLELLDLALALERAATDDRIAGVYLRVGSPGYGWAKGEEIRRRLQRFRESGKFVHAFTATTNELGYYVALAADRIHVLPGSGLELNGFRAEVPFIRGLLEKVGLEAQVEAVGVYKSAADILRRDNMSPEDREVTEAILAERYERFVSAVAESRGIDRARFTAALDAGVYLVPDLLALRLVDGATHEADVLREAVALALGVDPDDVDPVEVGDHLVHVSAYAADLPSPPGRVEGTIGLVYAVGAITAGESGFDPLFGRTMGAATMTRTIREAAGDEALDAVVIRVDSPGGDALASEEIWAAIAALGERIPVVVSMSDVAASGGYYIAAAADSIVAEPSTITGSIGVLGVLFNARELWDKLGISWDTAKTNPAADFPTTTRPLTEEERETFRALIEAFYRTFVGRVANGRDMPEAEVDSLARGRVWTGEQAVQIGLVDRLGGIEDALATAKGLAGIDPDATVRLHVYPGRPGLLDQIRQVLRLQGSTAPGPRPTLGSPELDRSARELFGSVPAAGLIARDGPGRPLAVLPWMYEIR